MANDRDKCISHKCIWILATMVQIQPAAIHNGIWPEAMQMGLNKQEFIMQTNALSKALVPLHEKNVQQ